MAPPKAESPSLWIVAGPNGSGKSTFYGATGIEAVGQSVWIINPDALSARLEEGEGLARDEANREALNRIAAWLEASVNAHQTVGVETVLSTDKYKGLVGRAKARGFEICLVFVTLRSADLNVERVRRRVAEGGHAVPENKIRDRRQRSFEQLPWFLDAADRAFIFDNSGAKPRLVGRKAGSVIAIDRDAPDEITAAVESLRTE